MRLSIHEQERLLIHVAAMVARDRQQRGVVLNHPEAVALITSFVMEGARDGARVAELAEAARHVLSRADVMEGVPEWCPRCRSRRPFPTGPSWSPCTTRFNERPGRHGR